jgi:putative ABC transport system ATP-binding protein
VTDERTAPTLVMVPVQVPSPTLPPVIDIVDGVKSYRTGSLQVDALRGVTLRVDRGEMVAITGPSGSGKSTLMHVIGCLDVLTSGSYRLAGEDVAAMSEEQLAWVRNRRIGFVFQQFNLLASLTAWRNVELPLIYAGVGRDERRQRALEALDRVGLADRVEHRPGELSGGQQQRVAIARALVKNPKVLLADEPTGNLDEVTRDEIVAILESLWHDRGLTLVVVTHDSTVARRAERIAVIRGGRLNEVPQGAARR